MSAKVPSSIKTSNVRKYFKVGDLVLLNIGNKKLMVISKNFGNGQYNLKYRSKDRADEGAHVMGNNYEGNPVSSNDFTQFDPVETATAIVDENEDLVQREIQDMSSGKTYKMLQTAVQLCELCDQSLSSQYRGSTGKFSTAITACGYTAPLMAIAVMFLDQYGITDIETIPRINVQLPSGQCVQLTREILTAGFNQATGYLWNLHSSSGVGIDELIQNQSQVFTDKLVAGVNVISFADPDNNMLSQHHSFIYIPSSISEYCYIVDSWGDERAYRPIRIRKYPKREILRVLETINRLTNSVEDTAILRDLMITYFEDPVPGGSGFRKLIVRALDPRFISQIVQQHFLEGCSGKIDFGGKTKYKKSKKRKSRRSRKSKKRKTN